MGSHDVSVPPGPPVVVVCRQLFGLPRVLMGSHDVSGPPVVVVCHQLEWVVCLLPPDGFSTCYVVPHMVTQCLTTFRLCSMVVNSTLNHLTSIPNEFSTTLPPWISCSWLLSLLWSVGIYCKA